MEISYLCALGVRIWRSGRGGIERGYQFCGVALAIREINGAWVNLWQGMHVAAATQHRRPVHAPRLPLHLGWDVISTRCVENKTVTPPLHVASPLFRGGECPVVPAALPWEGSRRPALCSLFKKREGLHHKSPGGRLKDSSSGFRIYRLDHSRHEGTIRSVSHIP